MAEKDLDTSDGPSLELPSFGLGSLRRRHKGAKAAPEPTPDESASPVIESAPESLDEPGADVEPAADEPVVDEAETSDGVVPDPPVDGPDPSDADDLEAEPVGDEPVVDEPVGDEPVGDEPVVDEPVVDEPVVDEPVVDEPVVDEPVVDEPVVEGASETETIDAEPDPEGVEAANETADDEQTITIFEANEVSAAAAETDEVFAAAAGTDTAATAVLEAEEPELDGEPDPEVAAVAIAEADADAEKTVVRRERQPFRLPRVSPVVAVTITGVVIGFLLVGLVNLALHACDWLNGTKSCGGPGLFLLLAILVVLMTLGTRILRAWDREDAGTVAFLGVGLAAVIALVLLADQLLSVWMVVVIPVVTLVSFLLAHWISETIVDTDA